MIWEDLARIIKTLFIAMVLLLIAAFLIQVLNSSDVEGQDVRDTPEATRTRSWATTQPVFTNTPPPGATPVSTPTPAPTPTGPAPRIDVSCTADQGTWLCIVWVYPTYIAPLEILAVENYGQWFATFQHLGTIPGVGWGVAVRWSTVTPCSGKFAELQLMKMDLPISARVQQTQAPPLSPTYARYPVSWNCNFLPEIH